MNRKSWLVAGFALLLFALFLGVVLLRGAASPTSPKSAASQRPQGGGSAAELLAAATTSIAPITSTVHDRKVRNEVRDRIYANRGELPPEPGGVPRNAGVAPPAPAIAPEPRSDLALDRQYIRDVVREEFFPMAKQCYEAALTSNPKLSGKIVLAFTIVGDAKVGGIVESAKINPDSTIQDPKLLECFSESLMATAFKPPTKGGMLTVVYPFELSPDEPDAAPRGR